MYRRSLLLLWSCCLLLFAVSPTAARSPGRQGETSRFFPESGHTLREPFWSYWRAVPEPLRLFGYPISEPFIQESFTEPGRFFRVQFFERAILEEHPPAPEDPNAQPRVLGRLLGVQLVSKRLQEAPFRPVVETAATPEHAWDAVTQHTLADSPAPFKRFFESNGGLAVLGRPLSEQFEEQNADTGRKHWVQYFERQRLEWHPENADPAFQIQLGRLGDEYRAAHAASLDPAAFTWRNGPEPEAEPFAYGVNASLYYTDSARAARVAAEAGFGWIRQQVLWRAHQSADRSIAWEELDQVVEGASKAGRKLLLCVVQAPDWATGTPGVTGFPDAAHRADYAAFLAAIAARYGDKVTGFEIWNEMNLASENGGRPVPPTSDYVDLLVQAYNAVKAINPAALIVSGGPGPTEWGRGRDVAISDLQFFREMFADPRFWTHTDVVGVHVFGYANPPWTLWPEQPGPFPDWRDSREFYFRRVEDVRTEMVRAGFGHRQLWMTEFGWATANNTPMHEFGANNSFEKQAEYLLRAFEMGRTTYAPWLGAMFVWNLNFAVTWDGAGNPMHEQAAYGILNRDWSPRPAYEALARMPKR